MRKSKKFSPVPITETDNIELFTNNTQITFKCINCGCEYTKSIFAYKRYKLCKECVKVEMVKNLKNTCLEKYGVDNVWKDKEHIEKMKQTKKALYGSSNNINKWKETIKNKYGCDSYFQSEDFKEKSKETKLQKYGNATFVNVEKRKNTNLSKYGNTWGNKEKAKQTFLEKYGYTDFMQTLEFRNKARETLIETYGVDNFRKSSEYKDKYEQTCLNIYGKRHYSQTEDFHKKSYHRYRYKNQVFHSSWEVIFYIFCEDFNIECERDIEPLSYIYNDEIHYYFPDFKINDKLYEIKGDHFIKDNTLINPFTDSIKIKELNEAKTKCMVDNKVTIIDMKPILEYFKEAYNSNYLQQFKEI